MGRKKLGNVLWAKRVSPALAEKLDGVCLGLAGSLPTSVYPPPTVPDREQITALLDDIERLTKELEDERGKVKRALDLDLDEKGKLGWRLYFQLKEGKGKGEFDQE